MRESVVFMVLFACSFGIIVCFLFLVFCFVLFFLGTGICLLLSQNVQSLHILLQMQCQRGTASFLIARIVWLFMKVTLSRRC